VDGPTVDGLHLGSMYGQIAFVVGRLSHGVFALAPMALGAVFGVWVAARRAGSTPAGPSIFGWSLASLCTVAFLAVAVLVARPATTHPIVGADGAALPGSIAELRAVSIGGHEQVLMIRGRSRDNPVLLYLAGGPGGTDLGALRADVGLEQSFVVVAWEQRGAGKSYAAIDPLATLTLDQMVADTIAVTNYLREQFDEQKIYLVGNSWGTTLGVLAVQQHPELFHAYIGTGQMVSQRDTDRMFYDDTLAWAERTGNAALVARLRQNGPPPYENLLNYEQSNTYEHAWNAYPELNMNNEMPAILFVPEYTWIDRLNAFRGFLDSASALYPQLQDIDFRRDVTRLDVPVTIILGEHEARGRAVLARQWFDVLDASSKHLIVLERAGHRALFDQPAAFASIMSRVLDQTYGSNE
jgi:pimeloyl-ACP methyl ester carboxylesterase